MGTSEKIKGEIFGNTDVEMLLEMDMKVLEKLDVEILGKMDVEMEVIYLGI